ncbi:hypothetical protein [Lichenifustis flavocetrariae]|uniref:Uncharacterized protein n=1 Tax=Lichenifustis flavocetrariae TaxID=2949735 RepID=A0AA42CI92_9HYPH|nr:hypothetical protein [Lichenifustis flavocetrariae]MCW6506601.1 hypothetical protein [Lichenifustis flavocetrariae]
MIGDVPRLSPVSRADNAQLANEVKAELMFEPEGMSDVLSSLERPVNRDMRRLGSDARDDLHCAKAASALTPVIEVEKPDFGAAET